MARDVPNPGAYVRVNYLLTGHQFLFEEEMLMTKRLTTFMLDTENTAEVLGSQRAKKGSYAMSLNLTNREELQRMFGFVAMEEAEFVPVEDDKYTFIARYHSNNLTSKKRSQNKKAVARFLNIAKLAEMQRAKIIRSQKETIDDTTVSWR